MTQRALVVEDNPGIFTLIEGLMDSIGFTCLWAQTLADARHLIETEQFDVGLIDLEIPVRRDCPITAKENGERVVEEVQRIKGPSRVPLIVMTSYGFYCANNAVRLRAKGVTDFITKPFDDETRTLTWLVRDVLLRFERQMVVREPAPGLRPFTGGELVFYPDRVELLGVEIISGRGKCIAMQILQRLRGKDSLGNFVRKSGEELLQAIGSQDSESAIRGAIRVLKRNVVVRLRKYLNIEARDDDVIANNEGYYLCDWITVSDGKSAVNTDSPENVLAATLAQPKIVQMPDAEADDPWNERQYWVVKECSRGTRVEREMLEQRFDVSAKTAKRDLATLARQRILEFVRVGSGGYYRLAKSAMQQAS